MITLNFDVNDQTLTRQDENTVAANSRLVHLCEFNFSSEWDGRGKVATFKKRNLRISVILDNDACVLPPEILQSDNKIDVFELSVCGADGNSTITSTIARVPILAGTWDPFTEEITPTLFEQIMQKIDEIEKGEISPELIYEAVTEYMEAHPLEPIIADDVAAYFAEHAEELKGPKGDTGATPSITATAEVNNAVGTPSVTVTKTGTAEAPNLNFAFQNLKGVKGDTGATPVISAAATVDNTTGTPAVNVSKTGTDAAPEFTFAFSGLKGEPGEVGATKAELIAATNYNEGIIERYITDGKNLFDAATCLDGYRVNSLGEVTTNGSETLYLSDYIKIEAETDYTISVTDGNYLTIAKYNNLFEWDSNTLLNSTNVRGGYTFRYANDSYIRVFAPIVEKNNTQIEKGATKTELEKYSPSLSASVNVPYVAKPSIYKLPYIKNGRLCCNRVGVSATANYAGVDLGEKVNHIHVKFILEDQSKVSGGAGTVALVLNKNGVKRINNITDLSIHCTISKAKLRVDIFADTFGTRYYQNIIDENITLAADGITEHSAILGASPTSNIIRVIIDDVTYTGTFIPTTDIASLDDVIGNYAIIEHYCEGDRDNVAMPMFTYFAVENLSSSTVLVDYFDRQDGQLSTAPNGTPYSLMNNEAYR